MPQPPLAPKKPHVNVWHGVEVPDPWYWLRDKADPEVVAYLEAENAYLDASAPELKGFAEALYVEMLARIKQTDLSVPSRRGAHYYYARTEEGKQYTIQCRRRAASDGSDDPSATEEIVLDLNVLAAGHAYFSIASLALSDDAQQVLFATDTTGFRQYSLYLKDLRTGEVRGPLAERVTSVAWLASDHHAVITTEDEVTKRSDKLWRLDLSNGGLTLLFEETDELYSIGVERTRDRRYLICDSQSTDTWESAILSSADLEGGFRVVLPRDKGHKYTVDHRDGLLYLHTNRDAKNFRLVTAPIDEPARWTELVPHRQDTLLESVDLFARHLVLQEKREALVRFRILSLEGLSPAPPPDGGPFRGPPSQDERAPRAGSSALAEARWEVPAHAWREVSFPETVYDAGLMGTFEWNAPAFRFSYESMITPPAVCEAAFTDAAVTVLKRTEVLGGYDPTLYASERRWVVARDGVRVPISMVYKKTTPLDGSAPCLLYGYGSYGLGMSAEFSSSRISVLDRGMVYVIAHIRGGDELGEAWHDEGMLMKKKNTFFDFIDVAEYLLEARLTSRDRLLAEGGSAGGLLIGAVVNMRPELWKAVHAAVPFVDVLNTMFDDSLPLTIGEYLEWGDPNEPDAFEYIRSYSPYDNVEPKAYPAILVTTGINDSQVMYWEPAKWVAKLRHTKTDQNPLHMKCNMGAGHGGASGRYDRLKEVSFEWAWLLAQVGITR